MSTPGKSANKSPEANHSAPSIHEIYWLEYIIKMKQLEIEAYWVKGHNGDPI